MQLLHPLVEPVSDHVSKAELPETASHPPLGFKMVAPFTAQVHRRPLTQFKEVPDRARSWVAALLETCIHTQDLLAPSQPQDSPQ